MSNVFDPQLYLDATIEQPTVKRPAAKAGVPFLSMIKDVKARPWQKKDDPSVSGMALDVVHEITLTGDVAKEVGQEKITLTDGFIIDLTDGGTLDNSPGKNRRVRQYRDALDMNKPGDTWSPRRMVGRSLLTVLDHELYLGDIQERIGALAKAG